MAYRIFKAKCSKPIQNLRVGHGGPPKADAGGLQVQDKPGLQIQTIFLKKSLKYTLLFSKRHCTNMFTNIICVVDTLLFYRQGSRSLRNSHAQCHMARNCLVLVYIVPDRTYPLDYNNLKCVDIC